MARNPPAGADRCGNVVACRMRFVGAGPVLQPRGRGDKLQQRCGRGRIAGRWPFENTGLSLAIPNRDALIFERLRFHPEQPESQRIATSRFVLPISQRESFLSTFDHSPDVIALWPERPRNST